MVVVQKVLLDSHVFLDFFFDSDNYEIAEKWIANIKKGKYAGVVSTAALMEVKYRIMRKYNHNKALDALLLIKGIQNLEIISVSPEIAENAAVIRFKYYKKNEKEISYADCVHIATALVEACALVVSGDPVFKNIDEIKTDVY